MKTCEGNTCQQHCPKPVEPKPTKLPKGFKVKRGDRFNNGYNCIVLELTGISALVYWEHLRDDGEATYPKFLTQAEMGQAIKDIGGNVQTIPLIMLTKYVRL